MSMKFKLEDDALMKSPEYGNHLKSVFGNLYPPTEVEKRRNFIYKLGQLSWSPVALVSFIKPYLNDFYEAGTLPFLLSAIHPKLLSNVKIMYGDGDRETVTVSGTEWVFVNCRRIVAPGRTHADIYNTGMITPDGSKTETEVIAGEESTVNAYGAVNVMADGKAVVRLHSGTRLRGLSEDNTVSYKARSLEDMQVFIQYRMPHPRANSSFKSSSAVVKVWTPGMWCILSLTPDGWKVAKDYKVLTSVTEN